VSPAWPATHSVWRRQRATPTEEIPKPNKKTCKLSNGTKAALPRSSGDGRFDGYFIFFSLFLFSDGVVPNYRKMGKEDKYSS
jgi:hypothetical protein